jgi:hypothetical protein
MWGNAIIGCSTGQVAAFLNYQALVLLLEPVGLPMWPVLALFWGILVMSAVQGNYLRPYTRPPHKWLLNSVSYAALGYFFMSMITNEWGIQPYTSLFMIMMSSSGQTRILAQTVGNAPIWMLINFICWLCLSMLLW